MRFPNEGAKEVQACKEMDVRRREFGKKAVQKTGTSAFTNKHLYFCAAHQTQKKHHFTNVCVCVCVCMQTAMLQSPNLPPRLLIGSLSHE